jgi:hypothetical protein
MIPMLESVRITDDAGRDANNRLLYSANGGNGWKTTLSGRGIGWIRPTPYFVYGLWKNDPNDIRNSGYNIVRDVQITGVPTSNPAYGKWFVADGYYAKTVALAKSGNQSCREDTMRNFFPIFKKVTVDAEDFPSSLYTSPVAYSPIDGGTLLQNSSSDPYKPMYLHRLAETYLLRAEAYLLNNNKTAARDDINEIRRRANAYEITEADVTIDFILDERLRELYCEELRMLTLCRMGKQYDRTKKYNQASGLSIEPYHNLWPIPFQEIERNTEAKLTQNPGYPGAD